MRQLVAMGALVLIASACDAPKRGAAGIPEPVTPAQADTAFQAMNARHDEAVGSDPMALEHQFVSQPDGGDIILERQIHQDLGINQIRAHLLLISRSFANGDFTTPGFVHDKPVPGTDVMAERASKISYTVEDTEHGGVVHIRTDDPEALKAIHSFIEFQIAEHHTQQ
ncbi:MAG TPA: hypothetical protein VM099_03980 [Gemmatimonadaceae bacterium]|nr:hypothetical protein [Gemmatimonadaceae bacterium]